MPEEGWDAIRIKRGVEQVRMRGEKGMRVDVEEIADGERI